MKLVTFHTSQEPATAARVGAVTLDGQRIVDLRYAASDATENAIYHDMLTWLEAGAVALDRTKYWPDAVVHWPGYCRRLDFEMELAIVVGRQGINIQEADALAYVAGYMLYNDFSARDTQLREMGGRLGPAKGKDFDTGNALGPFLVTTDEIAHPDQLTMRVFVNDELWTETSTATMHHSVATTIAYLSRDETLYPGDVIGLGTLPHGCGLELDRWIQPGDVVTLQCDALGKLTNRVARN